MKENSKENGVYQGAREAFEAGKEAAGDLPETEEILKRVQGTEINEMLKYSGHVRDIVLGMRLLIKSLNILAKYLDAYAEAAKS